MDINFGKLRELVVDREAWRAAVHGVTRSQMRLRDWTELMVGVEGLDLHQGSLRLLCSLCFMKMGRDLAFFSCR